MYTRTLTVVGIVVAVAIAGCTPTPPTPEPASNGELEQLQGELDQARQDLAACQQALSACTEGAGQSSPIPSVADLEEAARSAGVSIVTEGATTASQSGITFVAASIAGVEDIPPTAYREGVDVGFAYYENKSAGIAPGYYTLRVTAPVEEIGQVAAPMEFVDSDGRSVARMEGQMDVFSLTVPQDPPFAGNFITARVGFDEDESAQMRPIIIIGVWCSNGQHWIVIL